jgi:hypothetical protein
MMLEEARKDSREHDRKVTCIEQKLTKIAEDVETDRENHGMVVSNINKVMMGMATSIKNIEKE